jgi:hypothetical protein
MYLDDYTAIMNIVKGIAKENRDITPTEIRNLENLANASDIVIDDVAENNGLKDCFTWQDLVVAVREKLSKKVATN